MATEITPADDPIYQLKIVLTGISPMIWRRLLVRSSTTIAELHYIIQIAMGWEDEHLNRFHIYGKDRVNSNVKLTHFALKTAM
jgi:hypothetical protein